MLSVSTVPSEFGYHNNGSNSTANQEIISANETNQSQATNGCRYEFTEHLDIRFPLIVIVAGTICLFGIVGNLISLYVFTRKRMQTQSNYFLLLLAVCDLGVLTSSLLIYVVEVAYDYMASYVIYEVWFSYVKQIYLLSHICQGAAVYTTVAATIERWIAVGLPRSCLHIQAPCVCTFRSVLISIVVLVVLVILSQLPRYFEVELITNEDCRGFGRYMLAPSALLENQLYVAIYSVWITNIVYVFLPFIFLLVLNVAIFCKLSERKLERRNTMLSPWVKRIEDRIHKRKTREATIILLVVVFIFILCNFPSVVLTILEQVSPSFLESNGIFYSFSRDAVNILAVIDSSANFAAYLIFGKDFRKEMARIPKKFMHKFGCCESKAWQPAMALVRNRCTRRRKKLELFVYSQINNNNNFKVNAAEEDVEEETLSPQQACLIANSMALVKAMKAAETSVDDFQDNDDDVKVPVESNDLCIFNAAAEELLL